MLYRYIVVLFAIDSPSEVLGPYASAVAPNHMILAGCQHKRDAAGRRISGIATRVHRIRECQCEKFCTQGEGVSEYFP